MPVDVEQSASRDQRDQRQDRSHTEEGRRCSAERDEGGREQRPCCVAGHLEPFEQAEDAGERIGPRDALEQHAARHVERLLRAARQEQQAECRSDAGHRREPEKRHRPDGDRDGERAGQPGAADEACGERHREHAARSGRTAQVPRPVAAAMQDAARELDVEHVERSECDALGAEK